MKKLTQFSSTVAAILLVVACIAAPASAVDYNGFDDSQRTRVVYDFRHATPKTAEVFLSLLCDTFRDAALMSTEGGPEFTVVFMGPSLNLVTTPPADASADDRAIYERIAAKITEMKAAGIDFEVCLFAANLMGIAPQTLHADLRQIHNGFIASIGYQNAGYAMVPVF